MCRVEAFVGLFIIDEIFKNSLSLLRSHLSIDLSVSQVSPVDLMMQFSAPEPNKAVNIPSFFDPPRRGRGFDHSSWNSQHT